MRPPSLVPPYRAAMGRGTSAAGGGVGGAGANYPSTMQSSLHGSPPQPSAREELLLGMILQQHAALPLQRGLDDAGEHAEHARQEDLEVDLVLHDVDRRRHRLPHRGDVEVELVAGPARLHLRAARNML